MVIATRGRPEKLLETVRHTALNMSRDDTKLLICVDDDDQPTIDALPSLRMCDERITVSVKPREDSRGEKYDRALKEAKADVYLPAVDCAPILTPAWDQKIINVARLYEDGICCVHTPMVNAGGFPPALQAFTAKWVEKIGYIYNYEYPFWFIDHEADDMARLMCRYLPVQIEVSTAPMRPKKTHRLRDLVFWTTYYDEMTLERRKKAHAIVMSEDFQASPVDKLAILNNYVVTEQRSYGINAWVRANAAAIEKDRGEEGPPDPGYLRALKRAETKLEQVRAEMMKEAA